nr:peptidyl-prolyl cis-trans isomerase CYP19-4-like [Tanacetum cinerariifolium]
GIASEQKTLNSKVNHKEEGSKGDLDEVTHKVFFDVQAAGKPI